MINRALSFLHTWIPRCVPVLITALLNLTGLGLGYLYLRQFKRFVIGLLGSLVILAGTYFTVEQRWVYLWLGVILAWLILMAVDGGRLALKVEERLFQLPERINKFVPLLSLLVFLIVAGGVTTYFLVGDSYLTQGEQAYARGDCGNTYRLLGIYDRFFRLTYSPRISTARQMGNQCGFYLAGESASKTGHYADAIIAYEVSLVSPPADNTRQDLTREKAAQSHLLLAKQLTEQGSYPAALHELTVLQNSYGTSTSAAILDTEEIALRQDWAQTSYKDGDYSAAIEQYDNILAGFSDLVDPLEVLATSLPARLALCEQNMAERDYQAVIDQVEPLLPYRWKVNGFEPLLGHYLEARQLSAIQALNGKQYLLAIINYAAMTPWLNLTDQRPNEEKIVRTYFTWSDSAAAESKFSEAMQSLIDARSDYPGVLEDELRLHLVRTTILQSKAVSAKGDYYRGESLLLNLLGQYAEPELQAEIRTALSDFYSDYGQQLLDDRKYQDAYEKMALAETYAVSDNQKSTTTEKKEEVVRVLANDQGKEGTELMSNALEAACQGMAYSHPSLGYFEEIVNKRSMLCPSSTLTLPSELIARRPGEFVYAITIVDGTDRVEIKPYYPMYCYFSSCTATNWLYRDVLWKRVLIRDVRTGEIVGERKFSGTYPRPGGSTENFSGIYKTITGDPPKDKDIIAWIRYFLAQ